jgi:twitching motility protein PilU
MKAVVAQRLIPKKDGSGRCVAVEVLLNTPLVGDLIEKGKVSEIKDVMKRSRELGMQTFDQAVYDLYKAGEITYDDALKNADSANEVRLMIKLGAESGELPEDDAVRGLSLEPEDPGVIGRM